MSKEFRRKGQTLAEFGITLPILLLLMFGIIEFGRLFQSWVTIQNAAREATRYATTGQYDEEKYDIETILPCDATTAYGTLATTRFTPGGPLVNWSAIDHAAGATAEGDLYKTWYDGQECDPGSGEDLEKRKDMLRIASIMDRARIGASGLSLEDNRLVGSRESLEDVLFDLWRLPPPRRTEPGYFNISICSSRAVLNDTPIEDLDVSGTVDDAEKAERRVDINLTTRFKTMFDDSSLTEIPAAYDHGFPTPYCMLNERQPPHLRASGEATDNGGLPWLDPGGPGDRVSVFITYNHPLITPLGLAEYVQMEARRSGVNEAFRAARALNAVEGAPPGLGGIPTPTPLPPTETFTPSPTATATPSISPTPSNTPTETPGPFECEQLVVGELSFFGQRVFIEIENRNFEDTVLERVELNWSTPPDYPGMYVGAQAVNSAALWSGERKVSPFDTNAHFTPEESAAFFAADRTIPGQFDISVWEAAYFNAGFNLGAVMNPWDFHGTAFYFTDPDNPGTPCRVVYEFPPEDIPPSDTPAPDATDTYTPDCASSTLRVEFVRFDSFGAVQLRIINNRYQPAPFIGFSINWPDPTSYDPSLQNTLTLKKISAGGANADDFGLPDSTGVLVWRGRSDWGDGGSNGDRSPTTTHGEGEFWRDDYTFPPRSQTNLWLDFEGTSSTLSSAFGMGAWSFNGTQFDIGCGGSGGGPGPGGGGDDGSIFLSTVPPPGPTRTPRPTNTPGPTFTPSPTRPSPTPSNTWTPGPTKTPSNTPTITNTPPPLPPTDVPTQDGSGSETG